MTSPNYRTILAWPDLKACKICPGLLEINNWSHEDQQQLFILNALGQILARFHIWPGKNGSIIGDRHNGKEDVVGLHGGRGHPDNDQPKTLASSSSEDAGKSTDGQSI